MLSECFIKKNNNEINIWKLEEKRRKSNIEILIYHLNIYYLVILRHDTPCYIEIRIVGSYNWGDYHIIIKIQKIRYSTKKKTSSKRIS